VNTKYAIITVRELINSLPIKVKIPPKPESKLYLPALAQIVSNAFLAAVQKLSPVNAIYIYAFLLRNSINLSKHANMHDM